MNVERYHWFVSHVDIILYSSVIPEHHCLSVRPSGSHSLIAKLTPSYYPFSSFSFSVLPLHAN